MARGTMTAGHDAELTLERIVAAAVELLDAGGIDSFSMRNLARRLGHSTMAAYRHVPNREALLQLAADAVEADLPDVAGLPWYEQLAVYTRYRWTHTWRVHPWVVDYVGAGGVSRQQASSGAELMQVFRDAGFKGVDLKNAVLAHWAFVQGTLRFVLSSTRGSAPNDADAADAIFEFNLRAWISGFSAMINGWTPETLER
jgi:AcrR family transcriptional regulator